MIPPRSPLPPPRLGGSVPSPAGRVLAIIIGSFLLLIAVLFGPAIWTANKALMRVIEDWHSFVGGAIIVLVLALGLGIVGLLYAAVERQIGRARQAAIFKAPSGMPIHVRDVPAGRPKRGADGLAAQLLEQSMTDYAAWKLAESRREHPQLHSQSIHVQQLPPPPQIEDVTPPQLPQLTSGGSTLPQLRQLGHICRSDRSLLVGYSGGEPQYIELATCGFIGIGGAARSGKSTEALLLIEQAVLSGWHVFVADPHIHKADGLLNRCVPFSGRLAKQAVSPDEIATMIRTVDKIGRRRVQGDPDRTPCLLVIDEFTNLVWRQDLPDDILRILPSMAIEYAGVGVHGMIISHDYSRAGLGSELGAALRRSFTHRIAKRMDAGNVEFLFPKGSATQARAVAGLETNQGVYHGPDGTQTVIVPWCTDMDAAYAAQGTPPRPYAPRQLPAPSASSLPPTQRVAPPVLRPAPPTVPMNITVQEQIIDLLAARSGHMTASEIAAALRVDDKVIRTEIKELLDASQVTRRPCAGRTTKERYEYQSTNQPINQSITPSA